jgi:hypothetical protein
MSKYAGKLDALKRTQMAIRGLFTQKNMSMPPVQDNKIAAHFTLMKKAIETMFDGKPNNWPTFENKRSLKSNHMMEQRHP